MKNREGAVLQKGSMKEKAARLLLLTCVLFALLCLFLTFAMRRIVLENADSYTAATGQRLESQLDGMYDKVDFYAMNLATDADVAGFLKASSSSQIEYLRQVQQERVYYINMEPSIADVAFVSDSTQYSGIYSRQDMKEMRDQNLGNSFRWLSARQSSFLSRREDDPYLVYAREVYEQGEDIGTILISIDSGYFQISGDNEPDSSYLLAGGDGVIFCFNCTQEKGNEIFASWKRQQETGASGLLAAYSTNGIWSSSMGCWLVSGLDISSAEKILQGVQALLWLSVLLVITFLVVLFFLIAKNILRPLQRFQEIIRKVREQPEHRVKEEQTFRGASEITSIVHEFYQMLNEKDQLNRRIFAQATDLYEMKVQKQQTELAYLRSQIDPHFLYNTLEVTRQMAVEDHSPRTAAMMSDMARIFRYSTKGSDTVPLKEELEMIRAYLRIQSTRFSDRFRVFYAISPDTMDCQVIKMTLQPLAENAVIHGIEPKEGPGHLFIGSRIEGDRLILTIKDDGIGMPEETLQEIHSALECGTYDTTKHLGIINTQMRIRLHCGKDCGVRMESMPGDGTTAEIRMPVIREESEKQKAGEDDGAVISGSGSR